MIDESAVKSMERLHTLFACLFFFTPFILFPILSYRFFDWWILLSIPCYFLGGWLYRLRIIFYLISAGLVIYWIVKEFKITFSMYLFFAACLGCFAMILAHKYRMLALEYKVRFQERL
jgi:hypothetical protein